MYDLCKAKKVCEGGDEMDKTGEAAEQDGEEKKVTLFLFKVPFKHLLYTPKEEIYGYSPE